MRYRFLAYLLVLSLGHFYALACDEPNCTDFKGTEYKPIDGSDECKNRKGMDRIKCINEHNLNVCKNVMKKDDKYKKSCESICSVSPNKEDPRCKNHRPPAKSGEKNSASDLSPSDVLINFGGPKYVPLPGDDLAPARLPAVGGSGSKGDIE